MKSASIFFALALVAAPLIAQEATEHKPSTPTFDAAAASLVRDLEAKTAELSALYARIAAEKVPMTKELSELESRLAAVRRTQQERARAVDQSNLVLSNLRSEIKGLKAETDFVSNLLGEYTREFESGVHIAELQRYRESLEAAKLAVENTRLPAEAVYDAQVALVAASIERLHEARGGVVFAGRAVDADGLVAEGSFAMIGNAVLFCSTDGRAVGTAGSRMNSAEPVVTGFQDPALTAATTTLVRDGVGDFPFDPTDGNAHKVATADDTFLEEVQKGGPVMYPIFGMAGVALLLAIYKWLGMAFLRRPGRKAIEGLLAAVRGKDREAILDRARAMPGPAGKMLVAGAENVDESRELMEEVMYETVLKTRVRLNSLLPFIAICAASAPLLGLLGTVTGIINTFKLITIYGSGDVKTLSDGISEALVTTKYGLVVAIPSLLLHAYLSRKARGVVGGMETVAVAFVNQVAKAFRSPVDRQAMPDPTSGDAVVFGSVEPDPGLVRAQVTEILGEMLGPIARQGGGSAPIQNSNNVS